MLSVRTFIATLTFALFAVTALPGRSACDQKWPVPTPDPQTIALWHMDEGDVGLLTDSGPNRLDAQEGDDVRVVSGYAGNARYFDGTPGALVVIPWSKLLGDWRELTVEAWVRLSDASSGALQTIAAQWTPRSADCAWYFGVIGGGDPAELNAIAGINVENAGPSHLLFVWVSADHKYHYDVSEQTILSGMWTHVAVAFDGRRARFYRDHRAESAINDAADAMENQQDSPLVQPTHTPLTIGGFADRLLQNKSDVRAYVAPKGIGFTGDIDEVRVSKVARSDIEKGSSKKERR